MAVARLSRVTLEAPRNELGVLLARLMEFGTFHPSRREGMEQDMWMLLLGSRAQAVYGRAGELLEKTGFVKAATDGVEKFEARDVEGLINSLDEYVGTIEANVSLFTREEDRRGVAGVLVAVREASLMVFNNLQRILIYPPEGGSVRFEGFVPTKLLEKFRGTMGGYVRAVEPVTPKSKEEPYIPSLLLNPRAVAVFESLTLQRGLPRYGEVDPTPVLAFFFPFFFGIMFGDLGHGVVLFAFGLFLVYRTPYRSWGELVVALSFSTAIVGLVRGSFFGVSFASPLRSVVALPAAFSAGFTLSYIPLLLELAVVIGTVHLASGYAIAFVNHERMGDYADAFLDRLPTVVLYSSLVVFGFAVVGAGLNFGVLFNSAVPTPVLDDLLGLQVPISATAWFFLSLIIAATICLLAGHPAREYLETRKLGSAVKAVGVGLADVVVKFLEFFMNTLSYIRLGVLLITTTLLGSLAAGMLAYGIPGIVAAALLNLAVIGLEGVVVYIQDMRLQLYEWFSSFYSGSGEPFVPLVSGGKHFRIDWK